MKFRKILIPIAVLGFVLAGCGSSAPATEIDVTLDEFNMNPTSWTVAAGEQITINITNDGTVGHEWVILQDGVTIASEADLPETEEELLADFVYWEEEVDPGSTGTFTFTAPAAGTYQVICAIEDHFNGGMEGELITK
jgi:uncharacterized cupredoxin-like copper-binding protein